MNLDLEKLTLNGPIKSMPRRSKTCITLIEKSSCDQVTFGQFTQAKYPKI